MNSYSRVVQLNVLCSCENCFFFHSFIRCCILHTLPFSSLTRSCVLTTLFSLKHPHYVWHFLWISSVHLLFLFLKQSLVVWFRKSGFLDPLYPVFLNFLHKAHELRIVQEQFNIMWQRVENMLRPTMPLPFWPFSFSFKRLFGPCWFKFLFNTPGLTFLHVIQLVCCFSFIVGKARIDFWHLLMRAGLSTFYRGPIFEIRGAAFHVREAAEGRLLYWPKWSYWLTDKPIII